MKTITKSIGRPLLRVGLVIGILAMFALSDRLNAQGFWASYAPLPIPALRAGSGVFNGSLYVVGGEYGNGNADQTTVQVYNPSANSWTNATPLPYDVEGCGVSAPGNNLFVIGGVSYTSGGTAAPINYTNVSKYDATSATWTSASPLPVAKSLFATGSINGKIYVAGGGFINPGGQATILADAEVYDPIANTWSLLAPMPEPRWQMASAAVNGKLYVFGGQTPSSNNTDTMSEFDPATNTWTSKSPPPASHAAGVATTINGRIYVMGGDDNNGMLASVDIYDPTTDSWSSGVAMPIPRQYFAGGTVGSTIYVTAGEHPGGLDTSTYGFTPSPSYAALIQPPINADGTSVFTVNRGVVPVKFTLTNNGSPTCDLPPATIAVTRTAGGTTGGVNESVYSMSADSGSNFRIDSCQYVYNLNSGALGVGTYRVDILINAQVIGSAVFQLK